MKKRRFVIKESGILPILAALCLLAGCAPAPQHVGRLTLMNCTEKTLTVQSTIACPNDTYPAELTLAPGETRPIASTATYPDATPITIDNFLTNPTDATVTVTATVNGAVRAKTWTYAARTSPGKQLFNLTSCQLESSEDSRKNFTTENYVFTIREEDLKE